MLLVVEIISVIYLHFLLLGHKKYKQDMWMLMHYVCLSSSYSTSQESTYEMHKSRWVCNKISRTLEFFYIIS